MKILVLEDHAFQRAYLVTMLREIGVTEVYEAEEGNGALELLKQYGAVDIAFCDLQMEGLNGVDFLCQIANSNLVHSVVINSTLGLAYRQPVMALIPALGMNLLGDINKIVTKEEVLRLLNDYHFIRLAR